MEIPLLPCSRLITEYNWRLMTHGGLTLVCSGMVIYCWSSTAQYFLVLGPTDPIYGENVFTEQLPGNGRLLWLQYSGLQASSHIAPSLRLLVSSSLQVCSHFFCSGAVSLYDRPRQHHASPDASCSGFDCIQPLFLAVL
jgi:hypothetical protein